MEKGIAETRLAGYTWLEPFVLGLLAEAHLQERQPSVALTVVDQALAQIEQCGEYQFHSSIICTKADALLALEIPNEVTAMKCYESAIKIARFQSAKLWEIRAATRLAHLRHSQGQIKSARETLKPIYDSFTEGFDFADLKEAKALLQELA